MKLAIVATHPIQYQAPWFRHLAASLDVEVLYACRQDADGQSAAGFGVPFEWDRPLLDGYPFRWLENVASRPGVERFGGCDTPELFDMLRPDRYAACLILGWNRKCYLQAAAACWRSRVPLLVRGDSQLGTPRSGLRRALKRLPYRLLLPRCAGHLYVGQRNRDYLRHYGVPESKLFFTPHSVDNDFFATEAARARSAGVSAGLRARFGIGPSDFLALFAGKLIPVKRPHDLALACQGLPTLPSGRRLHLVFVGAGPLSGELHHFASAAGSRIHFAGFVNQTELPAWYGAADALLLGSTAETWGLVANEAVASGVPVIVSDTVGCAPDLVDVGRTGYVYPVGDVEALRRCLRDLDRRLASDPALIRNHLAAKARVYSYARATDGVRAALQSCCVAPGTVSAVVPDHIP